MPGDPGERKSTFRELWGEDSEPVPQPLDNCIAGSIKLRQATEDMGETSRQSSAIQSPRSGGQKSVRPLSGGHLSSRPTTKGDVRTPKGGADEPDLKFVELPFEKHEPSQTEKFLRDKKEKQIRNRENVCFANLTPVGREDQTREAIEGKGER